MCNMQGEKTRRCFIYKTPPTLLADFVVRGGGEEESVCHFILVFCTLLGGYVFGFGLAKSEGPLCILAQPLTQCSTVFSIDVYVLIGTE